MEQQVQISNSLANLVLLNICMYMYFKMQSPKGIVYTSLKEGNVDSVFLRCLFAVGDNTLICHSMSSKYNDLCIKYVQFFFFKGLRISRDFYRICWVWIRHIFCSSLCIPNSDLDVHR